MPRTSQSTEHGHGSLDDSCTASVGSAEGPHVASVLELWFGEASAMGTAPGSAAVVPVQSQIPWWGFWFGNLALLEEGGISCQVEHFTSPHGLWAVGLTRL